jgi:type I restriction enzyme S subunit
MLPDGWRQCRMGDLFESRRERGRPGLPLLSVTMNDGLVGREELDRKQDSALTPEEHLLVKPDDIAYNTMRMWQGAYGLADREGLVSPAYVVLKPNRSVIDPHFAYHLLKSPRMQHSLWAYSHGITDDRLRLYFDDFAKIPVRVPHLEVQKRIGSTLATWDLAIAASERAAQVERSEADTVIESLLLRAASGSRIAMLADCAEVIVSSVDKLTVEGEMPVLLCNYTDVYYNRHLDQDHPFGSGSASSAEVQRFRLIDNDVVLTKDSEEPTDIGVASCVVQAPPNLVCGYHLAIIRPLRGLLDGVLLQSIFALDSSRRHLFSHANGVTRFGLPVKAIETVEVPVPRQSAQFALRGALLAAERRWMLRCRATKLLQEQKKGLVQRLIAHEDGASIDPRGVRV